MENDVPPAGPQPAFDYMALFKRRWEPMDFVKLALLASIAGTFYYFYFQVKLFWGLDLFHWTWGRFEPRYNSEHCKLVPWIVLFLIWWNKEELIKARKEGHNSGLIWIGVGIFLFLLGVRSLQGRIPVAALPPLLYGSVVYLWGKEVGKALRFPILFLFFMVPISGPLDQATHSLQFLVVGIARAVCGLFGMGLYQEGTTLRPIDQSYKGFEIAEGCSGIRSLTAMVMITVIYVHLTQSKLWKKLVIFGCSLGFAIIGNAGRIVSIFFVAKFIGQDFAGGNYHEVSGYISFPIALMAMLGVSRLLDFPIFEAAKVIKTGEARPGSVLEPLTRKDTTTYDY